MADDSEDAGEPDLITCVFCGAVVNAQFEQVHGRWHESLRSVAGGNHGVFLGSPLRSHAGDRYDITRDPQRRAFE